MATKYASQQPSGFKNHLSNIAIVGIGGRSASFMANSLLETCRHNVTGIVREGSTSAVPAGVKTIKHVDYTDHASLVQALRGQDAVLITLSVMAPPETSQQIIDAAIEADVHWVMPNEWGPDLDNVAPAKESMMLDRYAPTRAYIEKVGAGGKLNWVTLSCGFWYEFSLGGGEGRYGFDFAKKELTLFDEGDVPISTTTWPQVGRAVAALMSLKILPDDEKDAEPCLARFANKQAHVLSFHVTQKEMFGSVLRVTGDKESDWKISHEPVSERFQRAVEMAKAGEISGMIMTLYARYFFKDAPGKFHLKLDNGVLGLPTEDLDEATRVGIEMAKSG